MDHKSRNILELIRSNARVIFGHQHTYDIITHQAESTSLPPSSSLVHYPATASLVAWQKDRDEIKIIRVYTTTETHRIRDALEGLQKRMCAEVEEFQEELGEGMVVQERMAL